MGDFSRELCGGTHLRASGEIGIFKITGESSSSSGIRRIEALAGEAAYRHLEQNLAVLQQVLAYFGQKADGLLPFLKSIEARSKEGEKQLKRGPAAPQADLDGLVRSAQTIGGVPTVIADLPGADREVLSGLADEIKNRIRGIVVLFANSEANGDGRSLIVASVFKGLTEKFNANIIIKQVAPMINGKGGGRSDFAQAGGEPIADLEGLKKKIACALRESHEA
jgi:alanyl-tRNA synthetase